MSTDSHLHDAEAQQTGDQYSEVGQAHSGANKLSLNTKSSPAMSKKGPLLCKWSTCHQQDIIFATPDDLAEHVHSNHIALFCDEEVVVCLWEGCKVYNKPSSSYTWLQRHMQQVHTKERPHKCIMNGCNLSFQSMDALQRHLERHLDPSPMPVSKSSATNVYPKPSPSLTHVTQDNLLLPAKRQCLETESSASDSAAEGKKWSHHLHSKGPGDTLKPRRRQSSLKVRIPRHSLMFAFSTPHVCGPAPLNGVHVHTEVLDHRTMSVIRHTAHQLAQFDIINGETSCIALKAMVLGRRKCCSRAEEEVLIRWVPTLVPDAWIPVSQYSDNRVVSLKELSSQQLSVLASNCFGFNKLQNRKSKRKPQ